MTPVENTKLLISLAELIKDPTVIFALFVIVIMAYIIIAQQKVIRENTVYERELTAELKENSSTLVRLTTLIETLVHGRGGPSS